MEQWFRMGHSGLLDVMLYGLPSVVILLIVILLFILVAKPARLCVRFLAVLRIDYEASSDKKKPPR